MNKILCASLLACATMNQAYAAHPLVTDDTGVQGAGHHQLEINTDWDQHEGNTSQVGVVTYTYGLIDQLDLYVNVPQTFRSPNGSGINDWSLGAKWRYFDRDGLSLGFKPEITMPSGNADKGLGTGKSGGALTALASYERGALALHGNLGFNYNRFKHELEEHDLRTMQWRASAATWYALDAQWKLVADTGVMQNIERANRTWPAYGLVGVIWSPNDSVDLDIGAKFGLNKAEVTRQIGVGVTLHF